MVIIPVCCSLLLRRVKRMMPNGRIFKALDKFEQPKHFNVRQDSNSTGSTDPRS